MMRSEAFQRGTRSPSPESTLKASVVGSRWTVRSIESRCGRYRKAITRRATINDSAKAMRGQEYRRN